MNNKIHSPVRVLKKIACLLLAASLLAGCARPVARPFHPNASQVRITQTMNAISGCERHLLISGDDGLFLRTETMMVRRANVLPDYSLELTVDGAPLVLQNGKPTTVNGLTYAVLVCAPNRFEIVDWPVTAEQLRKLAAADSITIHPYDTAENQKPIVLGRQDRRAIQKFVERHVP